MLTDVLPDPWDPDAFVGAFDDWARESGIRMLAAIRELVGKHFPDDIGT